MPGQIAAVAAALIALAGCSTPPVVYGPRDKPGDPPSGNVRALRELLPTDGRRVKLVLVHGVGDHCAGYALGAKGWLKASTAARIGLQPIAGTSTAGFVDVSVFMGGAKDARSGVGYATQSYDLQLAGASAKVRVDAIEITWSPLTQWVKSNQLGYDSPSTTPPPGAAPKGCTEAPDANIPPTKEPPQRLLLDTVIKELVFDRNLADAILYSGTYGATMERGVAEALCHALTGTPDAAKCAWPKEQPTNADAFFFVTHSLGSRIVYDTFLNLLDVKAVDKENPFSEQERRDARPAILTMLANTPAIYMMANQLAMLGLANVPRDARSGSGLHPYLVPMAALSAGPGAPDPRLVVVPPATLRRSGAGDAVFGNVLQALALARSAAIASTRAPSTTMRIVAFNDTNDLLTWHVPPWYANDDVLSPDRRPAIEVVNVFVQNTPKLVVIESPGPAHSGYFTNDRVWDVIRCGATDGRPTACP